MSEQKVPAEQKKISVIKATLSSGKVVLLKQMRVSHMEKAAEQVSARAGDSGNLMQVLIQKALVQLLLYQIDGKEVTMAQKDDMDDLFSIQEYSQILQVVGKISGGDDKSKEAKIEFVASIL
jgi:hypothetical protein